MKPPSVDIIDDTEPPSALAVEYLRALLLNALSAQKQNYHLTCILTDDCRIRRLNRDFRGIDAPTDVLSFDLGDAVHPEDNQLGEVYISLNRAEAQAKSADRSLQEEVAHLAVHGMLHLLGYEHDTDAGYARMQHKEAQFLKYAENDRAFNVSG